VGGTVPPEDPENEEDIDYPAVTGFQTGRG
jgi:hypothetical protein